MTTHYRHTQIGHMVLWSIGAALVLIVCITLNFRADWHVLVPAVILGLSMWLFGTLTTEVNERTVALRFGPGLVHKTFLLSGITSCRTVKTRWYHGWGIHYTPCGWLFNVSGFDAVEVTMKSGRKYRIGTDDPQGLLAALQQGVRSAE